MKNERDRLDDDDLHEAEIKAAKAALMENAEQITRYIAGCIRRGIVLPNADVWADALQRVADGLAARPKVEDAEIERSLRYLRQASSVIEEREAADLLERLAGERDKLLQRDINWRHLMAADIGSEISSEQRAEAAEAKLAEREAELAEADAVIDYQLGTSDSIAYPEHHNDYILEAKERHAARHQQKDKS